jgi:hypothetical protein
MSEEKKPGTEKDPPMPREASKVAESTKRPKETGGPKGLEPTRYGDWERNGRCFDF